MTKSRGILPPRRKWTEAEDDAIRRRYPHEPARAIAADLGCEVHLVHRRAYKFGLRKSAEFFASAASGRTWKGDTRGVAGRFRPGNVPWTAGQKGIIFGGRSAESRFQPGQTPHNVAPVGAIVMASIGYLKIKVGEGPRAWQLLHRKTWEDAHGPIPAGMCVAFRDDNTENCALGNLELITREENLARSTIHRYPAPLRDVIRLAARVRRKIDERNDGQHRSPADRAVQGAAGPDGCGEADGD